MPNDNSDDQTSVGPSVVAVAAQNKIPPFWKADPVLWFCQVEAVFARNQISNSLTKFHTVVATLEFDVLQQAADIVKSPGSNPYESLKTRLIETFAESENRRIQQLLEGKQLGDEKPSQLLRQMKHLAGDAVTIEMLRSLWLRSLPKSTQQVLAATESSDLDRLARVADEIHEVHFSKEVSPISSVNNPLHDEIERLSRQVAELRAELSASSRYRSREGSRSRARSKSSDRKRKDPEWLCFYHYKFRERAKKCESPCNWKSSGSKSHQDSEN